MDLISKEKKAGFMTPVEKSRFGRRMGGGRPYGAGDSLAAEKSRPALSPKHPHP